MNLAKDLKLPGRPHAFNPHIKLAEPQMTGAAGMLPCM